MGGWQKNKEVRVESRGDRSNDISASAQVKKEGKKKKENTVATGYAPTAALVRRREGGNKGERGKVFQARLELLYYKSR